MPVWEARGKAIKQKLNVKTSVSLLNPKTRKKTSDFKFCFVFICSDGVRVKENLGTRLVK